MKYKKRYRFFISIYSLLFIGSIFQACQLHKSYYLSNGAVQVMYDFLKQDPDFHPDLVFYYISGTLSLLTITIHMMTHSIPSFVYCDRKGIHCMPTHVTKLNSLSAITKHLEDQPKNTKILVMTDNPGLLLRKIFSLFPDLVKNTHLLILEEGTSFYSPMNEDIFDVLVNVRDVILSQESYENKYYQYFYKFSLNVIFPLLFSNRKQLNIHNGMNFSIVSSWCRYPEYLFKGNYSSLSQFFTKDQVDLSFKKLRLIDYFNKLDSSQKEKVQQMMGFFKRERQYNGKYKSVKDIFKKSKTPIILILLGLSSYEENYKICDRTMKLFGHKYTYIVKSHPSDRDSIQYVFQKDIKSLYTISSSIPVELVMCSYSKKIRAVVGEETSSFLSVPGDITIYLLKEPHLEPFKSMMLEGHPQFKFLLSSYP